MRAITLWQPWASLVARGLKTVETRSWPTIHRGYLAITASKSGKMEMLDALLAQTGLPPRVNDLVKGERWPCGVVVAVVHMIACIRTEEYRPKIDAIEAAFGDYSPGRWAWVFGAITALDRPVPCSGFRMLWTLPSDVNERVWADVGPKCRTDWATVKV